MGELRLHPLQNTIVRQAIASDQAQQHVWSARWIERGLRAYELQLDKRRSRFSAGDELSMAELFLVPQVSNAERFGADLAGCPRIRAIYELCLVPRHRGDDGLLACSLPPWHPRAS